MCEFHFVFTQVGLSKLSFGFRGRRTETTTANVVVMKEKEEHVEKGEKNTTKLKQKLHKLIMRVCMHVA